jgi:hypothetical protein
MQIALLFTFTLYTKLFQNPMPEAWPTSTPGTQNRGALVHEQQRTQKPFANKI